MLRRRPPVFRRLGLSIEIAAKALQPTLIRVPKGRQQPGVMSTHGGEEFLYVLRGTIRFYMDPYSPTILKPDDSVHFDSLMRRAIAAVGDEDAWVLSVRLSEEETVANTMQGSPDEPDRNVDDTDGGRWSGPP